MRKLLKQDKYFNTWNGRGSSEKDGTYVGEPVLGTSPGWTGGYGNDKAKVPGGSEGGPIDQV